jgi:hypothetical protein
MKAWIVAFVELFIFEGGGRDTVVGYAHRR